MLLCKKIMSLQQKNFKKLPFVYLHVLKLALFYSFALLMVIAKSYVSECFAVPSHYIQNL